MSDLCIEIAFALPEKQWLETLRVTNGTLIEDALAVSKISQRFRDDELSGLRVGVWGREVSRNTEVRDGDRIEIYRPLRLDPREARRQLAVSGRTMRTSAPRDASRD